MIVDSSILIAIAADEPGSDAYILALDAATVRLMSVANALEVHLVLSRRPLLGEYAGLLQRLEIELRPVTVEHLELARAAHDRFARGNHPAALNFGDCFAYALAKATGQPLLFKGDDFGRTDIKVAYL